MIDDSGSKVNLSVGPHLLQRAAQLIVGDVGQVVDGFDDRVEHVGAGGQRQLQIGQELFGVTGFRVGPGGRNQCVGDAQQRWRVRRQSGAAAAWCAVVEPTTVDADDCGHDCAFRAETCSTTFLPTRSARALMVQVGFAEPEVTKMLPSAM